MFWLSFSNLPLSSKTFLRGELLIICVNWLLILESVCFNTSLGIFFVFNKSSIFLVIFFASFESLFFNAFLISSSTSCTFGSKLFVLFSFDSFDSRKIPELFSVVLSVLSFT